MSFGENMGIILDCKFYIADIVFLLTTITLIRTCEQLVRALIADRSRGGCVKDYTVQACRRGNVLAIDQKVAVIVVVGTKWNIVLLVKIEGGYEVLKSVSSFVN